MEKYSILLGYWKKQLALIDRLYSEVVRISLDSYENKYVFSLKAQQLYTAIEDLLKQVAKAFENNISDVSSYHKELLVRLNTDVPKIRPALLSRESFLLLDEVRKFRHFIRHAYDCELDEKELKIILEKLKSDFHFVENDFASFEKYIVELQ